MYIILTILNFKMNLSNSQKKCLKISKVNYDVNDYPLRKKILQLTDCNMHSQNLILVLFKIKRMKLNDLPKVN